MDLPLDRRRLLTTAVLTAGSRPAIGSTADSAGIIHRPNNGRST